MLLQMEKWMSLIYLQISAESAAAAAVMQLIWRDAFFLCDQDIWYQMRGPGGSLLNTSHFPCFCVWSVSAPSSVKKSCSEFVFCKDFYL